MAGGPYCEDDIAAALKAIGVQRGDFWVAAGCGGPHVDALRVLLDVVLLDHPVREGDISSL